jgi:hypothetical protein
VSGTHAPWFKPFNRSKVQRLVKDIDVIFGAGRTLAKKLKPFDIFQTLNFERCQAYPGGLIDNRADAAFGQSAKPLKKRELVGITEIRCCFGIAVAGYPVFLAAFGDMLPEVYCLSESRTFHCGRAMTNRAFLQSIEFLDWYPAPLPFERDFDVIIGLYTAFAN